MTRQQQAIFERPHPSKADLRHGGGAPRGPAALALFESVASAFVARMLQGQVTALQRYEPQLQLRTAPETQELGEQHFAKLVSNASKLALPEPDNASARVLG